MQGVVFLRRPGRYVLISFNEGDGQRGFLDDLRKEHALSSVGEAVRRAIYELMAIKLGPNNPRPAPPGATLPPGAMLVKRTLLEAGAEGLSVSELIKATSLSQSTVSNSVQQLDKLGRLEVAGYKRPDAGGKGRIAFRWRLIGEDTAPTVDHAEIARAERQRAMVESAKFKHDVADPPASPPRGLRKISREEQHEIDQMERDSR